MKPVPDKPGFYRLIVLPEEFFEGIVPEGPRRPNPDHIWLPIDAWVQLPPDTTPWDGIYYETGVPLLDCE